MKDRKSWFHKILSVTAKETKLLIGKPPLTVGGLVSSGLQLGANVALDVVQGESASHEAGLTVNLDIKLLILGNYSVDQRQLFLDQFPKIGLRRRRRKNAPVRIIGETPTT